MNLTADGRRLCDLSRGDVQCDHILCYGEASSSYVNCMLIRGHYGKHISGHNYEWQSGDAREELAKKLKAKFEAQWREIRGR